jgi:hypothetical protein
MSNIAKFSFRLLVVFLLMSALGQAPAWGVSVTVSATGKDAATAAENARVAAVRQRLNALATKEVLAANEEFVRKTFILGYRDFSGPATVTESAIDKGLTKIKATVEVDEDKIRAALKELGPEDEPSRLTSRPGQPRDIDFKVMEQRLKDVNDYKSAVDFIKTIANDNGSMAEVVTFKAEYLKRQAAEIQRTGKIALVAAEQKAAANWGTLFGQQEKILVDSRQKVMTEAWKAGVEQFLKTPVGKSAAWVATMDEALFKAPKADIASDIDLTVITPDVRHAEIIRDSIEANLKRLTGMDMRALDAMVTAQNRARRDVYCGDDAAKWARQYANGNDAMHMLTLGQNGQLVSTPENNLMRKLEILVAAEYSSKVLDSQQADFQKLLKEGLKPLVEMVQPSMSLELLRHLNGDALNSKLKLPVHTQLLRIAKYDGLAKSHCTEKSA